MMKNFYKENYHERKKDYIINGGFVHWAAYAEWL
jgi:hypothetical protein